MTSEKADECPMVMEFIHVSRRIYGMPNFVFNAIADGLFLLAAKVGKGISDILRIRISSPPQLAFWYELGLQYSG